MKFFFIKTVYFFLLVFSTQVLLASIFVPKTPQKVRKLNFYLSNHTDIIYLGDSTIHHYSKKDSNQDAISDFIQEMFPTYSIGRVSAAAYHMGLFLEIVKYIIHHEYSPKVIIIPINLRSFSPEWDMKPEYQFEKEKLFLKLSIYNLFFAFYRPLAVFSNLRPITQDDYENTLVFNGHEYVGKVREFDNPSYRHYSEQHVRNKLIFNYMYVLTKGHRKIASMKEIVKLTRDSGIELIFYITPIDYQTGEEYLGKSFYQRVTQNVDVIRSLLAREGVDVIDLSFDINTECFTWGVDPNDHLYPNEHLKEHGRKRIAEQLVKRLSQILFMTSSTNH